MLARPSLSLHASAGPSSLSVVTRALHSSPSPRATLLKSTARFTWGVPPPAPPTPQPHAKPDACTHTSWPEFVPTPNHQRRSMAAWGPPLSGPPDRRIDPVRKAGPRAEVVQEQSEVTLDQYLVELTDALVEMAGAEGKAGEGKVLGLSGLLAEARGKAGEVLPVELKGEHAPSRERKVDCAQELAVGGTEQDGVVLVAHVVGGGKGGKSKVVTATGFAVGAGPSSTAGGPQTILTCLHPLEQVSWAGRYTSHGAFHLLMTIDGLSRLFKVTRRSQRVRPRSAQLRLPLSSSPRPATSTTPPPSPHHSLPLISSSSLSRRPPMPSTPTLPIPHL